MKQGEQGTAAPAATSTAQKPAFCSLIVETGALARLWLLGAATAPAEARLGRDLQLALMTGADLRGWTQQDVGRTRHRLSRSAHGRGMRPGRTGGELPRKLCAGGSGRGRRSASAAGRDLGLRLIERQGHRRRAWLGGGL